MLAAGATFIARWLVRRYAPEASGSGVQRVEALLHSDSGRLSPAVLPVKFAGGVLALGAGLALGREGPTVQMAAALGEAWARIFRLRPGDHRALLAAGNLFATGVQTLVPGLHLSLVAYASATPRCAGTQ